MHQEQHRHTFIHSGEASTEITKSATSSTSSSKSLKSIRQRPDLTDVIRSLRSNGRDDVADLITKLSGTVEVPGIDRSSSAVSEHGNEDRGTRTRRGKKYAYMYVNSTKASMDEQSKMLHSFIQMLRVKCKNKSKSKRSLSKSVSAMELIPITLPKNIVVLAMRLPLDLYNSSVIPRYLNGHAFMKVYLRKPRSDTQHLAQNVSVNVD